jgi:hypothetical protein
MAPGQSPQFTSIKAGLERVKSEFLQLLAVIPDEDRSKGARLGEYRTVEQMAYRPAEHFAEHAAHLRHILGLENGVAGG